MEIQGKVFQFFAYFKSQLTANDIMDSSLL